MPSYKKALYYLSHNRGQFLDSLVRNFGFMLPDRIYLQLRYRGVFGTWPNFKTPTTFNEKLNHLKLYKQKEIYSTFVDKFAVKKYISNIIGSEYVIPTIGIWENVDEIEWEELPERFVLKTTHSGGGVGVVICSDKENFDKKEAKVSLNIAMGKIAGKEFREKPYYNVPRRIIAEANIAPTDNTKELRDYKFFCCNGKVRCFKVDFNRFVEHHANYFDSNGNLLPFGEKVCPPDFSHQIILPDNLSQMVHIAEILASNEPFVRVDLYNVDERIYFGELTLYPAGGLGPFNSQQWDKWLGEKITI